MTHVFLLLVHVADLEPDVFLAQRPGRVVHNVTEALNHDQRAVDSKIRFEVFLTSRLCWNFCCCL